MLPATPIPRTSALALQKDVVFLQGGGRNHVYTSIVKIKSYEWIDNLKSKYSNKTKSLVVAPRA